MATKKVVIVTTSDDAHANHIAPLIKKRGAQAERLDGDLLSSYPIQITYENISRWSHSFPRDPDVVWYRKIVLPERFDQTSQFVRQETEGFTDAILLDYESARWISKRSAIAKARPKLYQLHVAHTLGFRVPKTLVTNNRERLQEFIEANGEVVAKPIQTQVLVTEESAVVVGTRKLFPSDVDAAVSFFPCFAQQRLKFDFEVRVIVLGEEMLAFKLTPLREAEDLKQLKLTEIRHEAYQLENELAAKIKKLVAYYELEFGALDFGFIGEEEPFFLELNPNGQWLWLQFATGVDLETPFIDHLLA